MTRVLSIANGRCCCIAALAAALTAGAGSQARAALYYWTDGEPAEYRPFPRHPHLQKLRHDHAQKNQPKNQKAERQSAKPQGPLIVAISINQQKLRIYDANGFFAESPVSTGMNGHPTPMGVFSVIQKQKYHESNIYSRAPMPYMQRITWSGVAIHAGVLPGYPASHGCIRMPMAFAIKMWAWTKLGARVVVIPGEMTPASFSHPLLPAVRIAALPAGAAQTTNNDPVGPKADKSIPDVTSVSADNPLELRASIGHRDPAKPAGDDSAMPLRDQMHTADASGEASANKATMSDVSPSTATARSQDKSGPDKPSDDAATPAAPSAAKSGDKSAGTGNATTDVKPVLPETSATPPQKIEATTPNIIDKDQSHPADAKREVPKRAGQIAVFISRKDSKLYVRQNFEPLFDVPVTIAPSDRPLGTHVFTAVIDRSDANSLHWSVFSLPSAARSAMQGRGEEHTARHLKGTTVVSQAKPGPQPDSPAEALDRITIPADAMARIADALTSGGSIIVSDQGINQGETGEGTDFIVSLR